MKRFWKAALCAVIAAAVMLALGCETRFVQAAAAQKPESPAGAPVYGDVCRPYLGPAIRLWPAMERMYYGRCFADIELSGLSPCEGSGSYLFWNAEMGSIAADSVGYCWANGTYDDGSPLAPCDGGSTLTLTAAKSGILRCWVWAAQTPVFSWHDGDTVLTVYEDTVGYDYNENGEAQQSYVQYRAWFMKDGTEYEIVGEAVDRAVFQSCVRQVMWGAQE